MNNFDQKKNTSTYCIFWKRYKKFVFGAFEVGKAQFFTSNFGLLVDVLTWLIGADWFAAVIWITILFRKKYVLILTRFLSFW